MQRHPVHRRSHAVLADTPVDVTTLAVVGVKDTQIAGFGVVGTGQVSRATDSFRHKRVDDGQRHFRCLAGCDLGLVFAHLLFQRFDSGGQLLGGIQRIGAVKAVLLLLGGFGKARFPGFTLGCAALADGFPLGFDVCGHFECAAGPAIGVLGRFQLFRVRQGAVTFGCVLRCVTQGDVGFAGNHGRLLGLFRGFDRGINRLGIVTVDFLNMPARRLEALHLVGAVRQLNSAVDGDVVVVPQNNQLAERVTTSKTDGFLADTFHQAAVACDHIGVVIHQLAAVLGALHFLCHGKTNGVGDALAQRTGGGFHRIDEEVFRVACSQGAHLAEVLDLLKRDLCVAHEIEQRIDQHGAVTGGQDKAVAVRPLWVRHVELHVFFKQDGRDIGHADGHAGMARIGRSNGIEGQGTDGRSLGPMFGVCVAQGSQIHWIFPLGFRQTGGSITVMWQRSSVCAASCANYVPQVLESKQGVIYPCMN